MINYKRYICALCLILTILFVLFYHNKYRHINLRHIFQINYQEDNVNCKFNAPCFYPEEVDLRIIVITFNRPVSLQKVLNTLQTLHLDGDTARLEIWIDRNKDQKIDNETLATAKNFTWKLGPTRVHIQESNAGIMGQWINTWAPRNNTKEIPLILEDDMSISPQSYRFLKAAHAAYKNRSDFAGVTLSSEYPSSHDGNKPLFGNKNQTAFMYICFGTWGCSPSQPVWRRFQNWFHRQVVKKDFHPYIPEAHTVTSWYKMFESRGTQSGMWEMWFLYFTNLVERRYTVFSNHFRMTGDGKSCMSINRKEVGLHYHSKGSETICQLLTTWKPEYAVMPKDIHMFNWAGNRVDNHTKV